MTPTGLLKLCATAALLSSVSACSSPDASADASTADTSPVVDAPTADSAAPSDLPTITDDGPVDAATPIDANATDTPAIDTPAIDTPPADTPPADAPATDTPTTDAPVADVSGSDVVEPPPDVPPPLDVPTVDAGPPTFSAVQLALGLEWTCARTSAGEVRCWGENTNATLGDGTRVSRPRSASVTEDADGGVFTGATAIESGYDRRVFALMPDHTLRQWGVAPGPVMEGMTSYLLHPTAAVTLADVAEVAQGIGFACARLTDGSARCWGVNGFGQLGDGTTTRRDAPAAVLSGGAPLTGVAQVVTGHHFACARMSDGTARCWGSNQYGQLGDGSATGTSARRASAGPVPGLTGVVELTAGHLHACARLMDGTVRCWGSNGAGQLGTGSTSAMSTTPVAVTGLTNATQLTAEGDSFASGVTCARRADATAVCWGANARGQLGDGTMTSRAAPAVVLRPDGAGPLTGVAVIATGGIHTCAIVTGGEVLCWGRNALGQLGDGTTVNRALPVPAR